MEKSVVFIIVPKGLYFSFSLAELEQTTTQIKTTI